MKKNKAKLCCLDCGLEYGTDNWMDSFLSNEQWNLIHPEGEGGILCANCILKRASKLGIFSVAKITLE